MSFLNPSILIALLAISIPIIIHLLNLRKIRKVEFSTLMFLKEIQKSKMRRIKLKQILLLLLRIFAITFLVLCFARPVYEGYAGSDTASKTTSLIFIDDSFSMNARDNNGLYFNQAKESVKRILNDHKESDEIYLVPTSSIAFKDKKILFGNFKELLDSLSNLKISYKTFSLNEVLSSSNEIIGESKNPVKEIFIISDFQKNNFQFDEKSYDKYPNLKSNFVNTYLINVGEREINNLSVDSLIVETKILEKDKDIKVKIYVNNFTGLNLKNKTVNLFIDNELRGEKVVDLNSFEKKEVEFIFKSSLSGSITGVIEIVQSEFQDDEIINDNKYFFNVYIPDKFEIGLLESNPADTRFIELAFKTASNILSDSVKRKSELFNLNSINSIDENIYKYDMIYVSNKRSFNDNEANILKEYVSGGGGLFLFLGKNTDIENYNSTILNKLNSVRIEKLNTDVQNENLKFDRVDFEHPVLSEVYQNQKLSITSDKFIIESPKISSYFDLLPNENSNSIISLTNNKPFLVESKYSKGKLILCAVAATDDLSDLPLKSIFVPLIIRSVYYLGNSYELQKNYIVGNSNLISVIGLTDVSGIISPDKKEVKTGIKFINNRENFLMLPYSPESSEIGNYVFEDSLNNKFNISLNYNPSESDPGKMSGDNIEKYFEDNGFANLKVIKSTENISDSIKQSQNGLGLWKYFLIAAILFIAAEMFLSKKLEES